MSDPTIPGWRAVTPLHNASCGGHLPIIKYLCEEQMCDAMCIDQTNSTPLLLSSENGHLNIVILEQQCDLTHQGIYSSVLHVAISSGHLHIVKFLIEEVKFDKNNQGWENHSPFHYASEYGYLEICKYLIDEHQCDYHGLDLTPCFT